MPDSQSISMLPPGPAASDPSSDVWSEKSMLGARSPRYFSLDSWRGLACLMIVVVHSQAFALAGLPASVTSSAKMLAHQIGWSGVILNRAMTHCDVGVPIFFVISGYCIAASCDSARRKPRCFKSFYLRRFRRIFPPYWVYLALITSLFLMLALLGMSRSLLDVRGVALSAPWDYNVLQLIGGLLLTSTWLDRILHGGLISGQAWSLCYEEQFYLIAGLLLMWTPKRFFLGVAGISAAVLIVFLASPKIGIDVHGFFFDGFWLLFAAGVLVFYRVNYSSVANKRWPDAVLFGALLLMTYVTQHRNSQWYGSWFFPSGIIFALLICWLHPFDVRLASHRLLRPLSFCGRMCYSLYLIHYPIVAIVSHQFFSAGIRGFWMTVLVTIPVCLVVSVVAAYVFHVLVERRFQSRPSAMRQSKILLSSDRQMQIQASAVAP